MPEYHAVGQHKPDCACCPANDPRRVRSMSTDRVAAHRIARFWKSTGEIVNVRVVPDPETARLTLIVGGNQIAAR